MAIEMRGTVVAGKGEARKLGYPTANIEHPGVSPVEPGVWTCYVQMQGTTKPGLAIVGMWQQENGAPSVEVHIMDFSGEIYGQELTVGLQEKLRDLHAFGSVSELVQAIEQDIAQARTRFV